MIINFNVLCERACVSITSRESDGTIAEVSTCCAHRRTDAGKRGWMQGKRNASSELMFEFSHTLFSLNICQQHHRMQNATDVRHSGETVILILFHSFHSPASPFLCLTHPSFSFSFFLFFQFHSAFHPSFRHDEMREILQRIIAILIGKFFDSSVVMQRLNLRQRWKRRGCHRATNSFVCLCTHAFQFSIRCSDIGQSKLTERNKFSDEWNRNIDSY